MNNDYDNQVPVQPIVEQPVEPVQQPNNDEPKKGAKPIIAIISIIINIILILVVGVLVEKVIDNKENNKEVEKNPLENTSWYIYAYGELVDGEIKFLSDNKFEIRSEFEVTKGEYRISNDMILMKAPDSNEMIGLYKVGDKYCSSFTDCSESDVYFSTKKDDKLEPKDANGLAKSAFVLFAEKVITAVQTQFTYDIELGEIAEPKRVFLYNIAYDLSLTSTESYTGYVIVDNLDLVGEPHYILYLYNNKYMIYGHDVTTDGIPNADDVMDYDKTLADKYMGTELMACAHSWDSVISHSGDGYCYNRSGYKIVIK